MSNSYYKRYQKLLAKQKKVEGKNLSDFKIVVLMKMYLFGLNRIQVIGH